MRGPSRETRRGEASLREHAEAPGLDAERHVEHAAGGLRIFSAPC